MRGLILTLLMTVYLNISLFIRGVWSISFTKINKTLRKHPFIHLISRLFADRKQPKGIPYLDSYEKVSERTSRILGLNPGAHTLQGTNTYLIGTTNEKILIDTGEDVTSSKYVEYLFDVIFPLTNTTHLKYILLTHGHSDHQGGVLDIIKTCKHRKLPIPIIYKNNVINGEYPTKGFIAQHIQHLDRFEVSGANIRAIYTPGHTDDHVAFILEEDNALLSGDCVLGCGTAVFDDLYTYMKSLKYLQTLFNTTTTINHETGKEIHPPLPEIKKIYPGHGPVIEKDAIHKIEEYIHHRQEREHQIKALLLIVHNHHQDNREATWLSSWEIMKSIYPPLPFMTQISAQWNVSHHLEKLKTEETIEYRWPDLWRIKIQD